MILTQFIDRVMDMNFLPLPQNQCCCHRFSSWNLNQGGFQPFFLNDLIRVWIPRSLGATDLIHRQGDGHSTFSVAAVPVHRQSDGHSALACAAKSAQV